MYYFFLFLIISSVFASPEKYEGYKVVRVYPSDKSHFEVLKRLQSSKQGGLEVLDHNPKPSDAWVDVLASPEVLNDFVSLLQLLQIPLETVVPDLPQAIADHLQENDQLAHHEADQGGVVRLDRYHTLQEITQWMHKMANDHHELAQIITLGHSYEGRPLEVMKLGQISNHIEKKPAVWLDAGIHSNEWIGPATMLYFIDQLLNDSEDSNKLLEMFDWYIMPVFNVDGYVYTWTNDRLWRKSRSLMGQSQCAGVDLNRNWQVPKGRKHEARDLRECGRTYPGSHPLSEPETRAVAAFLQLHNDSVIAYLAYHSFSQMWMTPYGYSQTDKPANFDKMIHMAVEIANAIESVNGTKYAVGTVADLIGITAGSSVDYTAHFLGIRYSFGIELRDSGKYGTLLPPDQILPNSEESWEGIKRMAQLLMEDLNLVEKRIPPEM